MSEKGCLLAVESITHSYPHDDRLKKKVIFRAVKQWFCSIEKIKPQLLDEIDNKIKWHNDFGQKRMHNMIADRGDWCISRQRLWGVPIPIIYCEDGSPIMDMEVFEHIADLFEQHGSNIWFESEAKDLLPYGYVNEKSPNGLFTKEKDIMDVWFDSGSSWNELSARGYDYPCDLYFEGSDQYRGWFNSSLIVSTAVNGTAPYKEVLSHGYVCDSKGEKMSKSVGNVVNPMDIINKNGADVFRLWAMTSDFKEDLKLGPSNIKQVSDQYRKVRNTFRFLLGNLNPADFDPKKDMIAYENLEPVDQYVMIQLNEVIEKTVKAVLSYDYIDANKTLVNFMTNDLSSYYCDFTKDILYCSAKNDTRRRQVQSVFWQATDALVKLWAPFLVYTMEEVWMHFTDDSVESVHYAHFPTAVHYENEAEVKAMFTTLNGIKDDVNKALEEARANKEIGTSQEAEVQLAVTEEEKELLEKGLKGEAAQWMIVSRAVVTAASDRSVKVVKAAGEKCPRCWNYTLEADENGLCPRCAAVLKKEAE